MTVRDALEYGSQSLRDSPGDTPYLDAVILLCRVLRLSKEQLFARLSDPVAREEEEEFAELLQKRSSGIPVAYLTGTKEFFGREFAVDPRVLIPRPETETLVDAVLQLPLPDKQSCRLHDCCTGSGCIAVTLAAERPDLAVSASDISREALDLFCTNSRTLLGRELPHFQSDLLSSVPGSFEVIAANPPYVREEELQKMPNVGDESGGEPSLSLAAGADGLTVLKRLIPEAFSKLTNRGYFVTEIGYDQDRVVCGLFSQAGFTDIETRRDLEGRARLCIGRR